METRRFRGVAFCVNGFKFRAWVSPKQIEGEIKCFPVSVLRDKICPRRMIKRVPIPDIYEFDALTPTELIGCRYVNPHLSEQGAEVCDLLE